MAESKGSSRTEKRPFRVEGVANIEAAGELPPDFALTAFVFRRGGDLLGSAPVGQKGAFTVDVGIEEPGDVEVCISPDRDAAAVRNSTAVSRSFLAAEWTKVQGGFRLKPEIAIGRAIWLPWLPQRFCVSGHIRKVDTRPDGSTHYCPVPFVKVEVFDVDREGCWWPYLRRWWDHLIDRPVIRVPDLIKDPPVVGPWPPIPDPIGPVIDPARGLARTAAPLEAAFAGAAVPSATNAISATADALSGRVGEMRLLSEDVATRLDKLTLTSIDPPWLRFPLCFYSRELVCEATTDCNGYFRCCFRWWPFHFRRGRLRFDARPDIIIRVTQVINGVETVLYMDPYTSTRWNAGSTHIDLFLDDDRIQCGAGCHPQPAGSAVFFTRIGNDEVYKIDQGSGLLDEAPFGGSLRNWAYGGLLEVHGAVGQALATGAPKRYYRLQYRKGSSGSFTDITRSLNDTRVNKSSLVSEAVHLGPFTVGGVDNLYEIRDSSHFYWYNPDLLGTWHTPPIEPDTALYTLRLEVFNAAGHHLGSAVVDYRDGTVPPPGPLPAMVDRCEMKIRLDNKGPVFDIDVPGANACGVIPWSPSLSVHAQVHANQENGRLQSWALTAYKGLSGIGTSVASASNNTGITPLPVNTAVSLNAIVAGATGTCAYALHLGGWALVRNGFGRIYYNAVTKAIAIEKCS